VGTHVRIHPGGFITIDTSAWIARLTGDPDTNLTDDLRTWQETLSTPVAGTIPIQDPATVAWAWCHARGRDIAWPGVIRHDATRLDARIWILRATAARHYPIAVIGLDAGAASHVTVYADTCRNTGAWIDADSVDIRCPAGHGWTWAGGRKLITAQGDVTNITRVFGTDFDAPFTTCPECERARSASRPHGCGCDATPWIICPICGRRCDVELPHH
jgi:hypothetical protein